MTNLKLFSSIILANRLNCFYCSNSNTNNHENLKLQKTATGGLCLFMLRHLLVNKTVFIFNPHIHCSNFKLLSVGIFVNLIKRYQRFLSSIVGITVYSHGKCAINTVLFIEDVCNKCHELFT